MNTHNGEDFLKEALESVLVQTYENFEIIFWDNCSDDNTQKIVNSYHDKRIKYFYSDEFTPLGEARNRAIDKSNGDLIAFLDCDDVWMSNKLELQVPVFDNKDIGIVISDTIFFDKKWRNASDEVALRTAILSTWRNRETKIKNIII